MHIHTHKKAKPVAAVYMVMPYPHACAPTDTPELVQGKPSWERD